MGWSVITNAGRNVEIGVGCLNADPSKLPITPFIRRRIIKGILVAKFVCHLAIDCFQILKRLGFIKAASGS
jgi:hypothetical protein